MVDEKIVLTRSQKINTPILSPKQVFLFVVITIYEVLSSLLPVLEGEDINWTITLINLVVGLLSYAAVMMLRAAKPSDVVDLGATKLFQEVIKRITETLFNPKLDGGEKIHQLELILVWVVREIDALYQTEYASLTEYLSAKINKLE